MKTPIGVDLEQYSIQGNAILGIKESGKTYTATSCAETLLDAKIPITVFDPIGVWRYLKVGKNGPGCPIVVAGENADIELTVESAPKIVRAAMQNRVPLVLDLYSMRFSKADWRRIVQESIEIMLYENKGYGLRHVFIEEAAEFVPQRVGPESGRVYTAVEKLARMGGNAALGYTLINQRAEEVNKAVLELCDCLILHRQKGRHSLTALGKWLDVADVSDSREIIKSLPGLVAGECWVWSQGSGRPIRMKVPPKRTVHPDRRNLQATTKGTPANVELWIASMNRMLAAEAKPKAEINVSPLNGRENRKDHDQMTAVISEHEKAHKVKDQQIRILKLRTMELRKAFKPQYDALKKLFLEDDSLISESSDDSVWDSWISKLEGRRKDMLRLFIEKRRLSRTQLRLQMQMKESGTFSTYLSSLTSTGLVKKDGDDYVLNEEAVR